MRVWVQDGRITRLEGDPDDPRSEGRLCAKGNASLQVVYHPDRLPHPLRCVGPRGSGEWERISWNEALDEIAERLLAYKAEFGAESVVFSQGTSRDYSFDLLRLCHAFGTPNFTSPSNICHLNAVAVGDKELTLTGLLVHAGMLQAVPSLVTGGLTGFNQVLMALGSSFLHSRLKSFHSLEQGVPAHEGLPG